MKVLKDILYKVGIEAVKGATDVVIQKIEFDSRKIELNDVFVAIRGAVSDGHDFIEKALSLGEKKAQELLNKQVITGAFIAVQGDTRKIGNIGALISPLNLN